MLNFSVALPVHSSSIEPKCFGSGYKPESAQKQHKRGDNIVSFQRSSFGKEVNEKESFTFYGE